MPLLMATPISPTSIFITREPYSLHPKPKHPTNPSSSRNKTPAIIASSSSSFKNEILPESDCPVPFDQQPVNEYTALSTSSPFSWASSDLHEFFTRLALLGSSFSVLVGLPVSAFGTQADDFRCGLGAASVGIVAVMVVVMRMYLGWVYVGNRLLSATVEYEETGWYDGQIWVKTPEVLARDRLLGSFSVKPLLTRVKFTLIGLAISLAVCVIIYIDVENPKNIPDNAREKVIAGVYNDEAARSYEADAFCEEPDLPQAS